MSTKPEIDPISQDLAQVMGNVARFSTNPEISRACQALLVAANELVCLRHEPKLRKEDIDYLNSALAWSEKARTIISDVAVQLHEGNE